VIRMFTVIVNDHPGVLNRVTGLFLRRGFNIHSIAVGTTENEGQSRMTIVLEVNDMAGAEQIMKQLYKQIDVLKVTDITEQPTVARELILVRVNSPLASRSELMTLIDPFRATVVDVSRDTVTIQATGDPDKVEALIHLIKPYGIKEMARTGVTAFTRDADKVTDLKGINRYKAL
jgi:acetolactate synthase-1/3 small subunit